VEDPAVVGVPVTVPVLVFRLSPAGKVPLVMAYLLALLATTPSLYAVLTRIEVLSVESVKEAAGASETAIDKSTDISEPDPFVAVTLKLEVPVAVGVPDIAPVEVLRVMPAGNEPLEIE
jgi:hypothetical protein